jgi:hypothetical protein
VRRDGPALVIALALGLALGLAACAPASLPAPSPPSISRVGIVTGLDLGNDFVRYTFDDGSTMQFDPTAYRQLTDDGWGGFGLVVIGFDADGQFVAAFPTQDGLPTDCYVENYEGIERGDYIQMHGVLWKKAPGFDDADLPDAGTAYPGGTRFCFNEHGEVSGIIPR